MGKSKDLSDFDKGQIVMARRMGQSISRTAALVGCSRSVVVSTYQKWCKEGQPENRRRGHGRPRLIDADGEQKLAQMVESHGRATVAQLAEQVNASSERKVSEYTVHRSLLRMGLRRRGVTGSHRWPFVTLYPSGGDITVAQTVAMDAISDYEKQDSPVGEEATAEEEEEEEEERTKD